ncbi:LacI family DNA-binding transcriptional regulator [Pseudonocardia sp.]|jgi:LacI family transcriptional regulator|uniref:LacI family DNA-binding transcriptional regulator n=1 Tax=Pseudonocardia sp. TaxID=60912 RepID=UPI0026099716|nr:LacI family DNA-binding transcriptional regulator [Pseudonocardia sp.]MCW2722427.1 LacI family transcriptional regulator [Pseudonocardia sp.]
MAVRMRDVARLAGVSDATVSLALSGNPRVSEATRRRVIAIADELGYRPNAAARSLRTDSTRALGLVVSDVANPFFAELAGRIERIAGAQGYSVVLCNSDEDAERQDGYLSRLLAGSQVDGVMLVPAGGATPGIFAAGAARARMVLLDRPIAVDGAGDVAEWLRAVPVVRGSGASALGEVAELLIGLGHRRIGIIALPRTTRIGRERHDLMVDALTRRGLAGSAIEVVCGDFRQHSGELAVERLLASPNPPTAYVAADGLMAIGAMKALRRAGVRIPQDVSLVGYDDAPWFDLLDPPLTTVAQPVVELAEAAVRSMLALLAGETPPTTALTCQLVRRSSCGPPPDTHT